jgi:putative transposase
MKLTEQIQLKKTAQLSLLCHSSKNLYNLANYYVRQELFYLGDWLRYHDLWYMLKHKEAYRKLPSQTAQQVLRVVDKNWKSFFNSCKEWRECPGKFQGRPRPPKYKKKAGEFIVLFTNQQCRIKEGFLYFPEKAGISPIKTRLKERLHQVRIVPKGIYYVIEIIYEKEGVDLNLDETRIIGIDLGLNNLVTMVNNAGIRPAIIKGGAVKSINQFYNKKLAKYKSDKDKHGLMTVTRRLHRLARKRNNKIHDFFHKISRRIINYCIENDFGTIIIGYNRDWKQGITLGRKNNQNFVQLPFHKLIHQLKYKSELVGISVLLEEESFTSKCSFLDGEPITKHECYMGKRMSRGLFKSKKGILINADVNAGYNIIKKAVPNAISADGIEGVGFHPCSVAIL